MLKNLVLIQVKILSKTKYLYRKRRISFIIIQISQGTKTLYITIRHSFWVL